MLRFNHKGGVAMEEKLLKRTDILKKLDLKKCKWKELKDQPQDVTTENFIDNVILAIDWLIGDIEKM